MSYKSYTEPRTKDLRRLALVHLGNCCCRCGFEDKRALQIDHVKGGGDLLTEKGRYLKVLATEPGAIFQCLCANCNWIKRHENAAIELPGSRRRRQVARDKPSNRFAFEFHPDGSFSWSES